MEYSKPIDYHLLSVNAGIIGAIFIFFSVAALAATDFAIFNFNPDGCSYGFNLEPAESQIAVTIAVGILLIPFAISSVMIMLKNSNAGFLTSIGFALIVASSIMIISSLACRIPIEFITKVMIIPAVVAIGIIIALFLIKKLNLELFSKSRYSSSKELKKI